MFLGCLEKNISLITQLRDQCKKDLAAGEKIEERMRSKCDDEYLKVHRYTVTSAGTQGVFQAKLVVSQSKSANLRKTFTVDARGVVWMCSCRMAITGVICPHIYAVARHTNLIEERKVSTKIDFDYNQTPEYHHCDLIHEKLNKFKGSLVDQTMIEDERRPDDAIVRPPCLGVEASKATCRKKPGDTSREVKAAQHMLRENADMWDDSDTSDSALTDDDKPMVRQGRIERCARDEVVECDKKAIENELLAKKLIGAAYELREKAKGLRNEHNIEKTSKERAAVSSIFYFCHILFLPYKFYFCHDIY